MWGCSRIWEKVRAWGVCGPPVATLRRLAGPELRFAAVEQGALCFLYSAARGSTESESHCFGAVTDRLRSASAKSL